MTDIGTAPCVPTAHHFYLNWPTLGLAVKSRPLHPPKRKAEVENSSPSIHKRQIGRSSVTTSRCHRSKTTRASRKSYHFHEVMSSEHRYSVSDDSGSEGSSSDDSHFSGARPKQPERSKKKDKKRAGHSNLDDDFDESEFLFRDRECDMSRSDGGGTLGAGLEERLNEMSCPSGGQGPMKKKKKAETRKQDGGGTVRHSGGQGGGGRSRSTNAGRTQRQGGGYNSFLDQAAEQQRTNAMGTGRRGVPSLTTSPKRLSASDQLAGRKKATKSDPGAPWISTQSNDEPQMSIGRLGMIGKKKPPSTTSKRSRDKRALDQSKSDAGSQQTESGPIDMTSDDNDAGRAKGASSRKRTPSPVHRDAGSDLESYGVGEVFPSGSGLGDGVDWELNADESSDSEDFAEASRKDEQSNGKRKNKARTSNKNGGSKPIEITEDDEENSGATQSSFLSQMVGSAKKILRGSGSSSKRGKDQQGESNKKNKIKPGCTFSHEQEDEILSFDDSQEDVRSSGKKGGQSKSRGIDPKGFHAKESKSNSGTLESFVTSGGRSKKASQYGGIGSISPRKRTSRRSKRKRKNEVITIDDSSSDDDAALSDDEYLDDLEQAKKNSLIESSNTPRAIGRRLIFDAARVAIGKKVFSHQCKLQIQLGSSNPFLRVSYTRDDGATNNKSKEVAHTIWDGSIRELRYFLAEQDEESDGEESVQPTASSGGDGLSFLAMRIAPTKDNGLQKLSNSYLQNCDEDDNDKRYVVVELRSDDVFTVALDEKLRKHPVFGGYFSEESRLDRDQAKQYSGALIEDDLKDKQKRVSMPGKRRTRSSSRAAKAKSDSDDNKIHLVYPFNAEEDFLENACKDLHELGGMLPVVEDGRFHWIEPVNSENSSSDSSSSVEASASASDDNGEGASASVASAPSKATARTHYLTIRQDEMERLEPGEFLNDTLIDFFMRWIWRNDDPKSSAVHFFTSHFFTTLDDEGPEAVSSWTAKKSIDIFKKRFIFIPINESLHWSLCVVVNPGCIENEFKDVEDQSDDQDFPFILFLDSLKAHRKVKVANKVRRWLNYEAKRLGKFKETFEDEAHPFNKKTMEVFDPKVPYQDNSWDCGVFVCRYAYGLYLIRNKRITYRTAGVEDEPPYLRELITRSPEFDFDMEDIARVREELKKLIQNLSSGYLEVKAKEEAERDEKRKAKKRKLMADAAAEASTADAKDGEGTKDEEKKESEDFNGEAKGGAVNPDVDGAEV